MPVGVDDVLVAAAMAAKLARFIELQVRLNNGESLTPGEVEELNTNKQLLWSQWSALAPRPPDPE